MKQNLTCINCPSGCQLTVTLDDQKHILRIEGNQCKLGETYAFTEITNPTRTVTSTVRLTGGPFAQLPVKTSKPIPKDRIMDCMRALKPIEITAPVTVGDVIVPHVCGTDADIVATRSVR
ncbi:MAG: DUF1667 domain-containing protein [Firmicutes bacterium]|nr:DUF1667 domain-containing protein [Bacillota bacterium]